jgi:hypothetical protein
MRLALGVKLIFFAVFRTMRAIDMEHMLSPNRSLVRHASGAVLIN